MYDDEAQTGQKELVERAAECVGRETLSKYLKLMVEDDENRSRS